MKNVAIIMAGGTGKRFWPMSRKDMPKQFLTLTDSPLSMLQLTIERIKDIVSYQDIYIVTNKLYEKIIHEQIPYIPLENILYEPIGKNTAPCIGFATAVIKKKYGDANVIVLASDHNIKNNILFKDTINQAIDNCQNNIVTIGIIPDRIETGYGYIKIGNKINDKNIYNVEQFVEKPNYETAQKYYNSQKYLWNSGMFIWRNEYIYNSFKEYCPSMYEQIEKIYYSYQTDSFEKTLSDMFNIMESISIDYAIMEKQKNILVIPGVFGWDDVGSWLSVERLQICNSENNIVKGNVVHIKSDNNIIINNNIDTIVATIGINNLVIVKTDKALLVMNKDDHFYMKELLDQINNSENSKYL